MPSSKKIVINLRMILIILILTLALHSRMRTPYIYNPHYMIASSESYYATYSKGRVFIGSQEYLDSVRNRISDHDIVVIDNRNDPDDPYMEVKISDPIYDKEIREEILELIIIYDYYRPSDWRRTLSSMRLEWFANNITYTLKHKLDFDADIVFRNSKEKKYHDVRVLNRLFKL